ncbi:MAG: beta-lactamase family protein [Fimbriimonadales bacterium]|nr:beta-lactamase family protein [Fimbriimonadales bacterium]
MRELLEKVRTETGAPALGALVGDSRRTRAQAVVGVREAGKSDKARTNDPFHIGSCTKAMTATLAARLVEQGKLRWEHTVAEAFPDLKTRIRLEYHSVTLRQLLYHRSGLPEDRAPNPVLFLKIRGLQGDMRQQRLKAVEWILEQEPAAEPGARFAYSNFGYLVAGAMLEQVTGRSWEELMREYLFKPLRMRTAGFGAPQHFAGHSGEPPKPTFYDNPPALGPAGTVHCSLRDWSAFVQLHLRGARRVKTTLLRPESFAELHADPYGQGYAMGWAITESGALTHAGSNVFWFAVALVEPSRDLFHLVATNWGHPKAREACDKALSALKTLAGR